MIVLGIDPGSRITGYALLQENTVGLKVLEYGALRLDLALTLPERLNELHSSLLKILMNYQPQALALENIFYAKCPRSAIVLGHARGAVMVAAASQGIPIFEYAPRLVKQSVSGAGTSSKLKVANLMKSHLNLENLPQPSDAADALAIAFTHLIHSNHSRLQQHWPKQLSPLTHSRRKRHKWTSADATKILTSNKR